MPRVPATSVLLVCLVCLVVCLPGFASDAASDTASDAGPTEVLPRADARAEFQAVCERFRRGDDPYFGTEIVRRLRAMLERPARDPAVRVGRRARLGVELLRLGENEEALERLREAWELANADDLPGARWDEIRRRLRRDLALAHLRLAEERNCVEHHAAASCIVPLLPEAVHRDPEPARRAAELYGELLADDAVPEPTRADPTLAWLHAVSRATAGDGPGGDPSGRDAGGRDAGWPWESAKEAKEAKEAEEADDEALPRWRQLGMAVGLHRRDLAGGAVMDDFDGDGDLDLVSSTNDPCGPMTALRNDGPPGDLARATFVDVTEAWGLDAQWGGLNLVHADADGDGDLDLYVLRGGWWNEYGTVRNSLLRNDLDAGSGAGSASADAAPGGFVDVTRGAGLDDPEAAPPAPTQTAAFADADGDGDLDLYVGHEATPRHPHPSRLYRNVTPADGGSGPRFEDATVEADVENLRYAKGVAWGDVDEDGDPDLYVSNLGAANRLYRNDSVPNDSDRAGATSGAAARLRFVDVAEELGVAGPASSFATWFFHADADGRLDLFVADYSAPYAVVHASLLGPPWSAGSEPEAGGSAGTLGGSPRLYLNRILTEGRFEDASAAWGLTQPALPMGANYGDVDGDGRPDVYLGTGVPDYEALMPNVLLRNTGSSFEDETYAAGLGHLQKGHGVAFGDLDGDGDEDLFHQLGGQYPGDVYTNALFENPSAPSPRETRPAPRHLTLRLRGDGANPFAVGARVAVRLRGDDVRGDDVRGGGDVRGGEVEVDRVRTVHALAGTGGSFGGSSHAVELGLGAAREIEHVTVRWPGTQRTSRWRGLAPDLAYRLPESPERGTRREGGSGAGRKGSAAGLSPQDLGGE